MYPSIFIALLDERELIPFEEWKEGNHHHKIINDNNIDCDLYNGKYIEIPNNATNGQVIRALFNPNHVERTDDGVIVENYDFECYSEGDTNSDDFVSGIWVPLKLK